MDLHELIDNIVSFGQSNLLITLIVTIAFLFLIYQRPKLILSLSVLLLVLAGIYYLIMDTATLGKTEKQRLIHQTEKWNER